MKLSERFAPYLSIGIQICGLSLGLLCNLVLARTLGSSGYGIYSIAYTAVCIIGMPIEVGLAMVMVRDIAAFRLVNDWARIRGAINASLLISLSFSVLWLVGCVIVFAFELGLTQYRVVALGAALLLPLAGLAAVRGSILRGFGYPLWGQALGTILRPGFFLLMLTVVTYTPWRQETTPGIQPNLALGLHVAASALALGCGVYLMRRILPSELRKISAAYEWHRWLRDIPGYSMMAAATAANNAIGSFMLAHYGLPEAVGIYKVAELGASLVAMPLNALAIHYSAEISKLIRENDPIKLQATLKRAARVAILSALPVGLVFLAFGKEIIGYGFGPDYVEAAIPLGILSVAQLVNTFTGFVGIVMNMGGHHRICLSAVLIALIVQIVLGFIVVPLYSIAGAAISSAVATIIWTQILRNRVKRIYRVSTLSI